MLASTMKKPRSTTSHPPTHPHQRRSP
ncbi:hypothetical protein BJEO58_02897 [Brevibacterium jeotgali]|uniref:Uncharacterized protein n=1 Tax=Brevibacterium jeotgali TaxID=1262550 RepID=A0A2H1L9Z2_9MICO|nr:hypothetical protein BJEO58_02897 [Brevibacterium jeotgali]